MKPVRSQYVVCALLTAAVYIAGAKLGLRLAFVAEQVTVVWPPTGIALSAVFLFGYRICPAIALGAFIANVTTDTSVVASLGIATGNTLEAVTAAYLLNRFVRFRPSLDRFRDLFGLIFFGAMVSTAISATIGVVSLCVTGTQPWSGFGSLWINWYLGDAMGNVLVAPVILTLFAPDARARISRRGLSEFLTLIIVLAAINWFVFGMKSPLGPRYHPPDYAIFPVLIWSAMRFGTCGTAITALVTATIAVLGTVQGFGPFTAGSTNENLISLELFMFVAAVSGLILAVSETKRNGAERALQQSEERYRSLVLASSHVVWSTNAAGDVVDDLPTWRAFTGQSRADMMGRGWAGKLHPDDREQVSKVWEQSLAAGTPHEIEFRVLAVDGNYRHVFGRAVPVAERDGRIKEWVGMLTDITDKKTAEREMQDANRRKDEFLAMLAHELRNPLAPIRNAAQVLRLAGGDSQVQLAREVIERQVQQLTRLVDDLLDVSRITQGKIALQKTRIEVAAIIDRAIETSRPLIEARRHRLNICLPPETVWLEGDLTRLAQVVGNLLNNAAKYTEEGGLVSLNAAHTGQTLVLRIRDSGVGIPADVLPRVFDLFTQADRSLDRSQGGLGIGLTLVRSLVQMHGGRVEAFSDGPGRGSEFVVYLPALSLGSVTTDVTSRRNLQTSSHAGLRILVVDDNLDSAETIALLLQMSGHVVQMAYEGETALDRARSFLPQVILLDIGLPRMDGYEVARRLRQQPDMNKSFLIALTGYGRDQDRERSKEAGFDYHMVKPVDPAELEALLSSLVQQ